MTNSADNRDIVYNREAVFFDQEALENRKDLTFLYGGYGITLAREQLYHFAGDVKGKRILEYGCGNGTNLLYLASREASTVGIELSKQSVFRANQLFKERTITTQAIAIPMNAEQLGFQDNSFDVVLGTAILHHLELQQALPEIYRVLKPGGVGTFLEARGDNFLVNLYRKFTPSKRTPDEHPFVEAEFELLRASFEQVEVVSFYFTALFSFLLRRIWKNEAIFITLNRFLNKLDQKLIKIIPVLERFCWIAVIRVSKIE